MLSDYQLTCAGEVQVLSKRSELLLWLVSKSTVISEIDFGLYQTDGKFGKAARSKETTHPFWKTTRNKKDWCQKLNFLSKLMSYQRGQH